LRGSAARYFDRIFAHTGSSSIIAGSSRVIDSSRVFKGRVFEKKYTRHQEGLE